MIDPKEFEEIRYYYDEDVQEKLGNLLNEPAIEQCINMFFPGQDLEQFKAYARTLNTVEGFQRGIIGQVVEGVMKKCCDSVELRGAEHIVPGRAATYVTNHRDIVLDSAFLNTLLIRHNQPTAAIAIGDNLLAYDWIKDLVRLNKSFIVLRSLPPRQLLMASMRLSQYIHYVINERKNPVWIAQREGRSKDSSDETQASVIKMLALGGETKDIMQNIRHLNVQPVALSYEFDPCDYLKAAEYQLKRDNAAWKKSKADDLLSMQTGIFGYKGRVVFTITPEVNAIFDTYPWIDDKNAQVNTVCETIDHALHSNMVLFPINYLAYDLRFGTEKYADKMTAEERDKAVAYLNGQLAKIDVPNKDEDFLWERLLTMYSNPVVNMEKLKG
ncbi:MAG: 1-acyl-sn-glycerol-3-phosphate acyltransferase [Bacteroidales bacterium]|nr:1-acyl-sn-glycerol-3-phosphate acyltransferase [Bacteroidales bacterium]